MADVGIEPSVGSRGDSYDNALAESVIGLFKTEVIRRKGPWRHLEAVEFATRDWVDWFNHRRLLELIRYVPPAEYEGRYYEAGSGGLTHITRSPTIPLRFIAPREQQVMVPAQDVLIATSLILASAFLWGYLKWRARQPLLLLVGAIMLGAAAGYETYMHFVWEPTVHAPIRLDVFVLELPLMLLGVVLGVCSMIGRKAPPG